MIMDTTIEQCADLLTTWLSKESSPDNAKNIAKNIGYNDSPLFGAKKRKTRLIGELTMLNTALVIVAINQVFNENNAKKIIDKFLIISNKSIFSVMEKQYPDFRNTYEKRMAQYFKMIHQENPGVGVSFAFLSNLDLDPLKSINAQLYLSKKFGNSLTQTIDVLSRMNINE